MDDHLSTFMQSRIMSLYDDLLEEMTHIRLVNTTLGKDYVTYCVAYADENGGVITADTWDNRKYIISELLRLNMIPEDTYVTIIVTSNAWEVSMTSMEGLSFDEPETDPLVAMFLNLATFATMRNPDDTGTLKWLVDTKLAEVTPVKWSLPHSDFKATDVKVDNAVKVTTTAPNNDNFWTTPLLRTSLDLGPLGDIDILMAEKNVQRHLLKGKTTSVRPIVKYESRADYITMGTIIDGSLS